MAKGRRAHTRRPLVLGYLEGITSRVFSDYPKELAELAGRSRGVYSLYKAGALYYVGLATDLRGRVKKHLRDRHAGKWDTFSLYLVREAAHVKEMESLLLRIAQPKGNEVTGRLGRAVDLWPRLSGLMKKSDKEKQDRIKRASTRSRGKGRAAKSRKVRGRSKGRESLRPPALAPYVSGPMRLRRVYKGKVLVAHVRRSRRVHFDGKMYNSPSMAAVAAAGRPMNGWKFWRYRDERGEWVPLDRLRSGGKGQTGK